MKRDLKLTLIAIASFAAIAGAQIAATAILTGSKEEEHSFDGVVVTNPIDNLHTFNLKYKVKKDAEGQPTFIFQGTKGVNEYATVTGTKTTLNITVNSDRRTTDYINCIELMNVNTTDTVYSNAYGCETPIDLEGKILNSVRVSGKEDKCYTYMNSWKDEDTNETYNFIYIQFDKVVKAKDFNLEFTADAGVARFDLKKVSIMLNHDQDLSDTTAGPQIL